MHFREKLAKRAKKAGISVPEAVIPGLEGYFELLRKWNRSVALTALPVESLGDEAIDRLLIEPLIASRFLPPSSRTAIDVGTGGGSPAIPLKLANPVLSMRMIESKTRKSAFLREAIRELGLQGAEVETTRLEDLVRPGGIRETVDLVTMRAVRPDKTTLAAVEALVKPGGVLFLFRTASKGEAAPIEGALSRTLLKAQSTRPLLPSLRTELAIFSSSRRNTCPGLSARQKRISNSTLVKRIASPFLVTVRFALSIRRSPASMTRWLRPPVRRRRARIRLRSSRGENGLVM